MTIQADQILDLVSTTLRDLGRLRFTNLMSDLQNYVAFTSLMQEKRVTFGSGYGIQWNVMDGTSGAARETGLYEADELDIQDRMLTGNVPWRHNTVSYGIEHRELSMNRDPAKIVDLMTVRRVDALTDMAKLLENRAWTKPATSADNLRMFGIPYWIVYNATKGFTGGNPTGFSGGAGGIDSSTYTRWANWSEQYSNITNLISKWREAAVKCQFNAPVATPEYGGRALDSMGFYTNYTVLGQLETALENQNDNLGNDIASKDGMVVFRRVPVTYVSALDGTNGDPVYGIQWDQMKFGILEGEYLRETGPRMDSNAHNVIRTDIDLSCNLYCTDRRSQFVLATADPSA